MSATYSPASTMVDPLSPHLLSPHDHELSRHLESPLEPLPTDPEPDLDALVELGTLGTPVGSPRKRPSLDDAAGFGARDKLRRLESIAAALARCGGSMATERDILRFLLAQNEDGDVVDDEDDEETSSSTTTTRSVPRRTRRRPTTRATTPTTQTKSLDTGSGLASSSTTCTTPPPDSR